MNQPLVSCVMPTYNRRPFIAAAIDCWMRQTYENRELVILDDGDRIDDLIPDDDRVVYERTGRVSTGVKRNLVNALAEGEIICHWDDDDWSAPGRVADQVSRLMYSGKSVTGYGTMLFWDTVTRQVKRYKTNVPNYVCGTSMMYWKEFWEIHRFQDKQKSSDNSFLYPVLNQVASSHETQFMVARIHGEHTSSKDGIREVVSREVVPAEFWANEELRLRCQ